MIQHFTIGLEAKPRGFHIITHDLLQSLPAFPAQGILSVFIHHTSAAITINEAADPDVLVDFENYLNYLVPENMDFLIHTIEGPDDMPAHVKAALIGNHIQIPIINGKLALGMWQGIYLCEFRNTGGSRKLTATIYS